MRVLFLTLYPESGASSRYRVLQFLSFLRANGVDCTVACPFTETEFVRLRDRAAHGRARDYHVHEFKSRTRQILTGRRYDVVVLQKAVMSAYIRGMAGLVRKFSKRLVYDIDDAVNLSPPHPLPRRWKWLGDRGQINKLLESADRVLAGNQWLAESARAARGRAEYFPTVVDTDRFVPADTPNENAFTVGWIGGPSTSAHIRPIAGVLNELSRADVWLVGADRIQASVTNAEYSAWSLDTEVRSIQTFSVGVMPLPKSEWARGKCALKALQYMACGVPCIATPFGAVLDIIEDGVNGLLADSPEEWTTAIDRLRDPALRRRLGEAGRQTVTERFSLSSAAPRFLQHLREVGA